MNNDISKKIEPSLKLISEYLMLTGSDRVVNKDSKFIIPSYQRRYSWDKNTCEKLYQDFKDYMENGNDNPYFFGTIIVDCSENNKFQLVDGQQRTITFILLFKAVLLVINEALSRLSKHPTEEINRTLYNLRAHRNEILNLLYKPQDGYEQDQLINNWSNVNKTIILESQSINEIDNYVNDLKQILLLEKFDANSIPDGIYQYSRGKKDETKFSAYFNNFRFFYSQLNNDFKDSQLLCRFVDTLLKKSQIIEIRSWQQQQAIQMFNSLNSTGMPLTAADIISALLYSNVSDDLRKDFISVWSDFRKNVEELENKGIINIDSVLQQFMYIHRALNKDSDETTPGVGNFYIRIQSHLLQKPFDLCSNFQKIADIWDCIIDNDLIKVVLRFNSNVKLYLIAYLYRFELEDLSDKLLPISECLLRLFAILELSDEVYSSRNFKSFLFKENLKIVDKDTPLNVIKENFSKKIKETWDKKDLYRKLSIYDGDALVFLNEYLYWKEKYQEDPERKFLINAVNVEHIMPSSGKNKLAIKHDANIDENNDEEFFFYVNQIGNKILLEENINKSISNDWFRTKKIKSVKEKLGYKDSKYNIAQDLVEYESDLWTKDDIKKATDKASLRILKFIFDDQNIKIDDLKDSIKDTECNN